MDYKPANKKYNLSYRLAQQIAQEIIADGWVEGRPLGQELELLEKYQVSRNSFREAIRILEWQGIAKSVRGHGGGLQVAAPAREAIINILRDYLQLTDVTFDEAIEASRTLNTLVVKLLASRIDSEGIEKLRGVIKERKVLHGSRTSEIEPLLNVFRELSHLTDNPALALLMEPLNDILVNYASLVRLSDEQFLAGGREVWSSLNKMIQSIIAADDSSAVYHMNKYLDIVHSTINPGEQMKSTEEQESRRRPQPLWIKDGSQKIAQSLVYDIKNDMVAKGLKPGDRIGLESDLIEKYEVSRAVFREALKLLEMIGIVELRRGRVGGIVVAEPDSTSIISTIIIFLSYANFDFNMLDETRTAIEVCTAQAAARHITPEGAERLKAVVELEKNAMGSDFIAASLRFHRLIGELSQNKVLGLYLEVIIESSLFNLADDTTVAKAIENADQIRASHQALAQAILDKDAAMSSRKMIEHRKFIGDLLREIYDARATDVVS